MLALLAEEADVAHQEDGVHREDAAVIAAAGVAQEVSVLRVVVAVDSAAEVVADLGAGVVLPEGAAEATDCSWKYSRCS